jgi:hypothetical protein
MEEFIYLKEESEFLLILITGVSVFGWVGYSIGCFENEGGKTVDIIRNINYTRIKSLFWETIK